MTLDKVLFIGDLNQELIEYQSFEQKYECIHYQITTREQLVEDFKTKFHDIKAIYAAWLGFHLIGGFNNELIEFAPINLQIITICSIGYDGFDLDKMSSKSIKLTNTPSLGSDHVADLVLYHTLSSFRFFQLFENELTKQQNTIKARVELQKKQLDNETGLIIDESEQQQHERGFAFGHHVGSQFPINSPTGHTLTIVGFGNIGQKIGSRLLAIGMKINYVKRVRLSESQESILPYKVTYYHSITEAAPFTNLMIFALPGTPETRNMFNLDIINLLPPRSRVINVGRGFIINDDDLLSGLQLGKLIFAGLDVFNGEPNVDPRLISRQDVLCTPHIGSATMENFNDSAIYCLQNIDRQLTGQDVYSRVIQIMEEIEQSNSGNIIITTTTPSKPTTTTITAIVSNSNNSNGKTPISNLQQQQLLGGLKRVAGTPLTPTFIQKNTRRRKISRENDGNFGDLVNIVDDDQNTTTANNNIDKGQDQEEWDHEEDEEEMATLHGSPNVNRRKHVVVVNNTSNTNANTKIIKTFDDVDINFIDIRRHKQEIDMMMDQFILLNDHNETKELLRFMIKEREQEKLYI